MKPEMLKFFEDLLNAPSPSGFEGPARRVWCDALKDTADELRVDVHGNAIATINASGSPHVMLAGHIDEIGLQICHIDDKGFMRFRTIGGHDLRTLAGRRIYIHTASGPILGVIGQKPPHLERDLDRDRRSPQNCVEFWIDCGFGNRKQAEKLVQIGDPVTFVETFSLLRNDIAVARTMDNRVGSFVVAEVLNALKKAKGLKAKVSSVATVQEEIGLRGAHTSTFGLAPDVGIAVDVTWATDNPSADAKMVGEAKLGSGPVLNRGANINPPLFDLMIDTAKKQKIPVQLRSAPTATGTDGNAMQISRSGVATMVIGVPNRYMHSTVEMCHLNDIENTIKLIVATIRRMDAKSSFIPQ